MKGYPRSLIYIYLAGTVVAFVWIFMNFATWCQDDDEVELLRKNLQIIQHKSETERKLISTLKREIDKIEVELSKSADQCNGSVKVVKGLPVIYVITPTHERLEQKADLTRFSYTLRHVPNIHWVVVEDAAQKSALVTKFLKNCKLPYKHLNVKTPDAVKLKESDPNWLKPRGVLQRNAGLEWVRANVRKPGVVYFGDDDNTYDLQMFEEMRFTKKVSVWPVGLVGYLRYESPVVKHGKVVGWYTYWKPQRAFAMDMAGFAVNVQLLHAHPRAMFRVSAGRGNQESDLLTQLGITLKDLEPRADNCTKVVGWYTYWKPQRAFAMDMAGFAVNVQLLHAHPRAMFRVSAGRGNQESDLLTQLGITLKDLEPRADNCTKILVWHTRTEKSSLKNEEKMMKIYGHNSDTNIEV